MWCGCVPGRSGPINTCHGAVTNKRRATQTRGDDVAQLPAPQRPNDCPPPAVGVAHQLPRAGAPPRRQTPANQRPRFVGWWEAHPPAAANQLSAWRGVGRWARGGRTGADGGSPVHSISPSEKPLGVRHHPLPSFPPPHPTPSTHSTLASPPHPRPTRMDYSLIIIKSYGRMSLHLSFRTAHRAFAYLVARDSHPAGRMNEPEKGQQSVSLCSASS